MNCLAHLMHDLFRKVTIIITTYYYLHQPSVWSGSYTREIGFNPPRVKVPKADELPHNSLPSLLHA